MLQQEDTFIAQKSSSDNSNCVI